MTIAEVAKHDRYPGEWILLGITVKGMGRRRPIRGYPAAIASKSRTALATSECRSPFVMPGLSPYDNESSE